MRESRRQPAERIRGFGTSVFTEMSRLAAQHGAVNLGQGFPDFAGPDFVKEAAVRAIRADVGAQVRSGAPLAVIESASVAADQSRVQAARSRVQVAEAAHARVTQLRAEGIAAEREVLAARQELDEARAELASAQRALRAEK